MSEVLMMRRLERRGNVLYAMRLNFGYLDLQARSGDEFPPLVQALLGVVLHPLTQPEAVSLWTDG